MSDDEHDEAECELTASWALQTIGRLTAERDAARDLAILAAFPPDDERIRHLTIGPRYDRNACEEGAGIFCTLCGEPVAFTVGEVSLLALLLEALAHDCA